MMKKLSVAVAHTGNNYSAMIDGVDIIVVSGNSVDEVKTNLISAIEETRSFYKRNGYPIPESLSDSYELELHEVDV